MDAGADNGGEIRTADRAPDDGPFCWQTKEARRMIRDKFAESRNVTSALALYDAFTEIASDEQNATFTASVPYIANLAGMSDRTAGPLIEPFEELGLILVKRNKVPGSKLKAPSTYTVLPFGNKRVTNTNKRASIRKDTQQHSLPRSEESYEETTTTEVEAEQLIAQFQPRYPHIDVRAEYRHWFKKTTSNRIEPRSSGFQAFLNKWRPRAKPLKRESYKSPAVRLRPIREVTDEERAATREKWHKEKAALLRNLNA